MYDLHPTDLKMITASKVCLMMAVQHSCRQIQHLKVSEPVMILLLLQLYKPGLHIEGFSKRVAALIVLVLGTVDIAGVGGSKVRERCETLIIIMNM